VSESGSPSKLKTLVQKSGFLSKFYDGS